MNPNKYGLTQEQAEKAVENAAKAKDILPTLELGKLAVGASATFTIESSEPETVAWEDNGESKEGAVLIVNHEGLRKNLWLSAKSLAQSMFVIAQDNGGSLTGVTVTVLVEEYTHAKYGATRGYRVQRQEA